MKKKECAKNLTFDTPSLQARLAHFRPGFGLQSVSIKFK